MIISLVLILICLLISLFPIFHILFLISFDKLIKYYSERKILD